VALLFTGLAKKDLVSIAKYTVSIGHPNPAAYLTGIRMRLLTMHNNKNPGVVGRTPGTMEWMLLPTSYIAVMKWKKGDAKIYRVLPSAKIRTSRPRIVRGRSSATSASS
jgi:hypothetical protein